MFVGAGTTNSTTLGRVGGSGDFIVVEAEVGHQDSVTRYLEAVDSVG